MRHWQQKKRRSFSKIIRWNAYLEEVAIPALAIAAKDSNSGVLRREQLIELKATTDEFVELVKDTVEMTNNKNVEVPRPKSAMLKGRLVAVPGRGAFDQAASELFVVAARAAGDETATCTSPGGLMGISAAADRKEGPIRYVLIITVGGVTRAQIDLLGRRAQRDLDPDLLGMFIANARQSIPQDPNDASATRVFSSLKSALRDSATVRATVLKAS